MTDGLLLMLARAMMYAGVLVAFGVPAYCACTSAPLRAVLRRGPTPWRIVAAASALGLAATVLHIVCLTAAMNGVELTAIDRDMISFTAQEMPVGRAALIRGVALIAMLPIVILWRGRFKIAAGVVAGGIANLSLPWNGHAMINEGTVGWVHLVTDQVHLLAAGLWIGGLVALVHIAASKNMDATMRESAFSGFSLLGSITVAALFLTGVVNTFMILGPPSPDWLTSAYVGLLTAKLVLFAIALLLAADNRFRLVPALSSGADRLHATGRLLTSVRVELAVLFAIIVVVAVLGVLQPD